MRPRPLVGYKGLRVAIAGTSLYRIHRLRNICNSFLLCNFDTWSNCHVMAFRLDALIRATADS